MPALPPIATAKALSCKSHVRFTPKSRRVQCTCPCLLRAISGLFGSKGVDQDLGGRSGRGRVLAGDQQSVSDEVDTPVFDFGESGTEAEQLVLNEERHDFGQANIRLLTVREPGHLLALDQRLAGGGLYVA